MTFGLLLCCRCCCYYRYTASCFAVFSLSTCRSIMLSVSRSTHSWYLSVVCSPALLMNINCRYFRWFIYSLRQSALHCFPHTDPPPRQRLHSRTFEGSDLVATPAVCRSPAATPAKCVIFDSCGITWHGVTWHLNRRHWQLNAHAGVSPHMYVCMGLACDFCIVPLGVHFTSFEFDICTSGRHIN